MCNSPITVDNQEVACRQCNQCLDSRRNQWIARCMAERSVAGQMLAITLTYADLPCGTRPHGATIFDYSHIQLWIKALRQSYFRHYGERGEIRYVACGEQGDKGTQRIHWHVLLFTDRPISVLGEWVEFYTGKTVQEPLCEVNYNWSLWPRGHCRVQQPGVQGIFYTVGYALKDQYTITKSENSTRHSKAQNWGASFFRMSKQPPIGLRFLERYFDDLEQIPAVPPDLRVSIPDYTGYWYLTGAFREYALHRCHAINKAFRAEHGRDLPQWSSLVSSVSPENEKDMENLEYGKVEKPEITPEQHEAEWERIKAAFFERQAEKNKSEDIRRIVRQCGNIRPCEGCRLAYTGEELDEIESEIAHQFDQWLYTKGDVLPDEEPKFIGEFERWYRAKFIPSQWCWNKDSESLRKSFRIAKSITDLERNIKGPFTDRGGASSSGKSPPPHRPCPPSDTSKR